MSEDIILKRLTDIEDMLNVLVENIVGLSRITYNKKQFCQLLGIAPKTLDNWCSQYNLPLRNEKREKGANSEFTSRDLQFMRKWMRENRKG